MHGEFLKLLGETKLGNEESMVEVIDRFRPTIKKFSRELGYETAETDLSVALIFYVIKTQDKRDLRQEEREQSYQKIISSLTDKLNIVEDVKKDISEIKQHVFKS